MKRELTAWSKSVKIEMIRRDWGHADLAKATGLSREYVCAVVNGRVISQAAIKQISDVLDIPDTADA